ncbi:MAG: hypothetical protein ACOVQ0_11875 [Novosphingobium sp.]|uniref:hypothetical protein n=1 Tax=Novosphingobium sp. TaxID=1874826 RepID=UPI003B9901D5
MANNGDITVTRRIHFFRVCHPAEIMPLLPASMAAIQNLPWEEQGRYQPDATDNSLLSLMPHNLSYPLRLEFGRTRRDNLPAIERKGIKTTLSIAEDAGLIDVSHIVIFEDGFVAAEFNRDAPRIRKLGEYLWFKGRNLSSAPRFQRLFERDLADVIRDMENVKYLEIEIPPDNIALVKKADRSLADALEAQRQVNQSKTLGLYFNARDPSDGRLKSLGLALVQAMRAPDGEDAYEKLQIRGIDPNTRKPRTMNLLEDYLVADVNFVRSSKKARSIDSTKAFSAIEEAYLQRREALQKSLRATLPWE